MLSRPLLFVPLIAYLGPCPGDAVVGCRSPVCRREVVLADSPVAMAGSRRKGFLGPVGLNLEVPLPDFQDGVGGPGSPAVACSGVVVIARLSDAFWHVPIAPSGRMFLFLGAGGNLSCSRPCPSD